MRSTLTREVHVTLRPNTSLNEALRVFNETGVDALAVLDRGKYVGAVTREDAVRYAPSPATTLSKWEMEYLLDEIEIQSQTLIKAIPVVEYRWETRHKLEALIGSGSTSSAVAVMSDGQFSHIEGWRELCRQLLSESPQLAGKRELVQPKEFALSV